MYMQNRNRLTDKENKLVVIQGVSGGGRDKSGAWDYRYKLKCII